jgi:hypothetical protein
MPNCNLIASNEDGKPRNVRFNLDWILVHCQDRIYELVVHLFPPFDFHKKAYKYVCLFFVKLDKQKNLHYQSANSILTVY